MAKFCKYCGKPLNEGLCDCAQAVEEAEAKASAQVMSAMKANSETTQSAAAPTLQQAEQAFQKTAQSIQQSQQAQQAVKILDRMKKLLIDFAKNPTAAMRRAVQENDKVPQYLTAAMFALITLICGGIMLRDDIFKGSRFGMSLMVVVMILIVRLIYAAGTYIMVKRQNSALSLKAVVGLFSMTLFVDAVMILMIMLSSLISLYELTFALVIFWMVSTVVMAFLATWVLNGGDMERAVRVTLLLQLVLTIILVFVARGFLVAGVKSTTNGIMRSLGL